MNQIEHVYHFIEDLSQKGKKPGTRKQYASDLKQFISWLDAVQKQDLLQIDGSQVTAYGMYLNEKGLSDVTIRRQISAIHQLLAFYHKDVTKTSKQVNPYKAKTLNPLDFISREEWETLLSSMQKPSHQPARDELIQRNLAIVHLARDLGLRPKDIVQIDMNDVNLAQSLIEIKRDGSRATYSLHNELAQLIRNYLKTIDPLKRPRYHTTDPLFVAFNNRSYDYQYDYLNAQPKRLSERSIQGMIKDEVTRAGLRPLSARNLRNSCILDHVVSGQSEGELQHHFGLSHPFSLHRYSKYLESVNS